MLRKHCVKVLCIALLLHVAHASAQDAEAVIDRPSYAILYTAWFKAATPWTTVRIRISRHSDWVRWIRLDVDPSRYRSFKASGKLQVDGAEVIWYPPAQDAWLQYKVNLESKRESGRFDGLVTDAWAMFRGEDLVPVKRVDMQDGTQSQAKLRLNLPEGWSMETPYSRYRSGRLKIDDPRGNFDRPEGWFLLGQIGSRRETIGNTRISIAAPTGQGARRMDMLALFHWTLPTLQQIFPAGPERLLVVSAGDPMWRGALSGPNSLFVHADRPLISENATSTFIHELVHVLMRARSRPGSDWIVEGMAEYYSLEVLRRSGTISERRFEQAHRDLAEWGKQAGPIETAHSQGATTARAVGILRAIDLQIRTLSDGRHSLDDVARDLALAAKPVTAQAFREIATRYAGSALTTIPASPPDSPDH